VVAGWLVLPEIREQRGARLPDAFSVVAVFLAISLVTLATVQGSEWGWGSAKEVALTVAAAAMLGLAVWRTLVHPRAVIEAALFASRPFATASIALFVYYVGFAAGLFVTVLFLQDYWAYSPLQAGLAMTPGPLAAAVFAINSAHISARFGQRFAAIAGPLFTAAGALFWLWAATEHASYLQGYLPGMLAVGTGAGLTQAPLIAAASTLPADRTTTGSAVLNMARQVGSALGVAAAVALIATAGADQLDGFHRCWWLVAAAGVAAAAVSIVGRRQGGAQASSRRRL
jgi:MFS family permease